MFAGEDFGERADDGGLAYTGTAGDDGHGILQGGDDGLPLLLRHAKVAAFHESGNGLFGVDQEIACRGVSQLSDTDGHSGFRLMEGDREDTSVVIDIFLRVLDGDASFLGERQNHLLDGIGFAAE